MLDATQLCKHLGYVLHTPVRLYSRDGELRAGESEGQEDPLVCDPGFAARLLAMRRADTPVLHYEFQSALYAVIPSGSGASFVLGPVCYARGTDEVSLAVAKAHRLRHPDIYRVTYVPLDIVLEHILILFHSASDIRMSRDDLAIQSPGTANFLREVGERAYSIVYHLRENESSHNSYAQEVREQKAIREGDLDALRRSWSELQEGQIGRLGKDEITHYRNLGIVVVTLACRSAMEGGVLPEIAYSLADSYTVKIGELTDPIEITKLFRGAEVQYAELVRDASSHAEQSRHVLRCKEIIHDRLHQRIRVEDLAAELGLTRGYLSQIFLKEEEIKLSAYIIREKIRASEYLLMRSKESIEQIAATFAFASQSHYGQAFKKQNGMTPGAFREKYQSRK